MGLGTAAQRCASGHGGRALAWVLTCALAACAPELTDDLPDLDLTAAYASVPLALRQEEGPSEMGFSDPILDRLMAAALQGNPGLATARARLRAAAAEARAAGATVTGNGDASLSFNSRGSDVFSLGLGARLDPSRAARRVAASARAEAAQYDARDARRLLLEELATTYVNLRYYQQLLEFRRADVASRRRTLSEIEILRGAGAATEMDVISARALLVEARGRLPGIEAEAVRQRNLLSTLVGRPVGDLDVNLAFTRTQPLPKGVADHGVPADLLRARPDIRRAERLYAAALADIAAARASLYPSLSLSGLVRVPLDGGAGTASLVPGLTIPVFARPSLKAGVEAADARAIAAFEQWRSTVLAAVEELESALAVRAAAGRAAIASAEVVALQRRALDLSRRLLVAGGEITALDILDREQALSAARATLAQDRREVALAHILLLAALGLDRVGVEKPRS
ncbi:MAG: TolC family protein [Rhodobacter sp.]|jgi:outer membrane protein, multidrug efflux system|nr:TolC family protein [Rhodobacter sp.]